MKNNKVLSVLFIFIIGIMSVVPAFAAEVETTTTTATTTVASAETVTVPDKTTETTETTGVDITATPVVPEQTPELVTEPDATEIEPNIPKQTGNQTTIYFKNVDIDCKVKIENVDTKEVIETEINKSNEWAYTGNIKPGTYKIVYIKPIVTQFKIKKISDKEGNEIKTFKVEDKQGAIQVIDIYVKIKITTGLLNFFKKNIIFDVLVILLFAMYFINKKGYRIPILSNWLDNYRN